MNSPELSPELLRAAQARGVATSYNASHRPDVTVAAATRGHGDSRDLADLATGTARELGAGFVLITPLHAAEPVPPISTSPYLPMSRRWVSPLYVRIEDVPEYKNLGFPERTRLSLLGQPLRASSQTPALIDPDAVWA